MKKKFIYYPLFLVAGIASQATAIERPKSMDEPEYLKEKKAKAVAEEEINEAIVEQEEAPMAWFGVIGELPDETLREHLSLDSGIVLRYIADNSPAAAAGLQKHDIVLEFGGQKVDSQQALRDAVLQFAPGEVISMDVMVKGKIEQKQVTLAERPEGNELGGIIPSWRNNAEGLFDLDNVPELKERFDDLGHLFPRGAGRQNFEEHLREMEERLKQMPGVELDIDELLKDLPHGEDAAKFFGLKESASVRLIDEEGSVEMKMNGESKEVTVRDLDGEIVYEGPWDTEQDRAGLPPAVRERIERLNLDEQANGIRLHFKDDEELGEGVDPR